MKKAVLCAGLLGAATSIFLLRPDTEHHTTQNHPCAMERKQTIEADLTPSEQPVETIPRPESIAASSSIDQLTRYEPVPTEDKRACLFFDNWRETRAFPQPTPAQTAERSSPLSCALRYYQPIREAMLEYHCTPNKALRNDSLDRVKNDLSDELRSMKNQDSRLSTILNLQQLVSDELARATDIRATCYLQSVRDKLSEEGAAIDTHSLLPANCYQYLVIMQSLPCESKRHWYNLWIGVKQQAQEHEILVRQGQARDSRAPIDTIIHMRFADNY